LQPVPNDGPHRPLEETGKALTGVQDPVLGAEEVDEELGLVDVERVDVEERIDDEEVRVDDEEVPRHRPKPFWHPVPQWSEVLPHQLYDEQHSLLVQTAPPKDDPQRSTLAARFSGLGAAKTPFVNSVRMETAIVAENFIMANRVKWEDA
jgi:hypothetical protein